MKILEVPGAWIDDAIVDDPLLGPAHVITSGDQTTTMSAIDWSRPTTIPTVAAPARLAPGAGGAIMNAIATRARDAGVLALRYAGRYPTAALFRTLLRSFRTTATEEDFTRHFGIAQEVPVDFVPAPFTRVDNAHGHVEIRDGKIERAMIDGVRYEIGGSPARLVEHPDPRFGRAPCMHAIVSFGDALYAKVATFDAESELIEGPHRIPRCTNEVVGRIFPAPLVIALAGLVADAVPAPLREDARRFLTEQTIRWADLGAKAATYDNGFVVHAAIWERIAPLGYPRLALALAEALAPLVTQVLVAKIARDVSLMSPTE